MTQHLSSDTLARFAARTLSAGETLHADRHLAQCGECRAALRVRTAAARDPLRARDGAGTVVEAVRRVAGRESGAAATHLIYEELEAYVDGRLLPAARAEADRHLQACRHCADDLADMQDYARELARPLTRQEPARLEEALPQEAPSAAATPSAAGAADDRGWWARFTQWFAGSPGLRAATAVLALGVAIGLLLQGGRESPTITSQSELERSASSGAPGATLPAGVDQGALAALAQATGEIGAAWRAGDYDTVARELGVRAAGGDAEAQAALALLHLTGQGVARDPVQAARLLRQAAGQGSVAAARNLEVLQAQGLLGEAQGPANGR